MCCYVGRFAPNLNANREGAWRSRIRCLCEARIPRVQSAFYTRPQPRKASRIRIIGASARRRKTGDSRACRQTPRATGLRHAWHSHCNKRVTANLLLPVGEGEGKSKNDRRQDDFVDAAGESQCVLRGCDGAMDKRTSHNTGRMTDAKRLFRHPTTQSSDLVDFFVCGGARGGDITTGTSRGNVCASDMQTGKGQRTVRTNRRDETGRRPELPQRSVQARWTGRRVRVYCVSTADLEGCHAAVGVSPNGGCHESTRYRLGLRATPRPASHGTYCRSYPSSLSGARRCAARIICRAAG